MTSSSSAPESTSNMQQAPPAYEIKGRTMKLEEWDLKVQTENPVDFISLAHHGCDIRSYYEKQELMDFFNMLNGPTYETLVKHFWVRASVYDRVASKVEKAEKFLIDPTLEGKTREEMGLEPFTYVEIRSNILGIPVAISKDMIACVLRRDASGKYAGEEIPNAKTSPWKEIVNMTMFGTKQSQPYCNLSKENKLLLKIQNENLLPKGGGSDQPSLGHKVFMHYFIKQEVKVNVPKYIFKYMIKELRNNQEKGRCWVPYGRLLSKIFYQGGILKAMKNINFFNDEQLGTVTGKVINGATLVKMHLIPAKAFKELSIDLKESRVVSEIVKDFPPICKQDPLVVQMAYIKDHYETYGEVIRLEDVPETMYGGALPVARSRKTKRKTTSKDEYLGSDASEELVQKVKRAKKEKAPMETDATGSAVPSIQEEVEDLYDVPLLRKRTRSGESDAASQIAPELPAIPKKKRRHAMRKVKQSQHIADDDQVAEATQLVTKVLGEKAAEESSL